MTKANDMAMQILTSVVEDGVINRWAKIPAFSHNDDLDGELIESVYITPFNEPSNVHYVNTGHVIDAMGRIALDEVWLVDRDLQQQILFMWATNEYGAGVGGNEATDDAIIQVVLYRDVPHGTLSIDTSHT